MSENIKEIITAIFGSLFILLSVWNIFKSRGSRRDNTDSAGLREEQRRVAEEQQRTIEKQRRAQKKNKSLLESNERLVTNNKILLTLNEAIYTNSQAVLENNMSLSESNKNLLNLNEKVHKDYEKSLIKLKTDNILTTILTSVISFFVGGAVGMLLTL